MSRCCKQMKTFFFCTKASTCHTPIYFHPPNAVISSQTWFSLQTQRQEQVLIWTFATNKCLPTGPHISWKFGEMLDHLRRTWGKEQGWEDAGSGELVQSSPGCTVHVTRMKLWEVRALKKDGLNRKWQKTNIYTQIQKRQTSLLLHGSSRLGWENQSLEERKQCQEKKKSFWPGNVIRAHEKFFLG